MATDSQNNRTEVITYAGPILCYNNVEVDHFMNLRNLSEPGDANTGGFGPVSYPSCGDQMKLCGK